MLLTHCAAFALKTGIIVSCAGDCFRGRGGGPFRGRSKSRDEKLYSIADIFSGSPPDGELPLPIRAQALGGGLGQARFLASLPEGGVTALAVTEGVLPSEVGGRQESFSAIEYSCIFDRLWVSLRGLGLTLRFQGARRKTSAALL